MADAKTWVALGVKSKSELQFVRKLGKGGFGVVSECKHLANPEGPPLAVKTVPVSKIQEHNLTTQIEREIQIQKALKHPHIIELYDYFCDRDYVYLVMQFAAGGNMFDKFCRLKVFTNEVAAKCFYELCSALEYMHTLDVPVVHRDLKPENILLDAEGSVFLADFGWSNIMRQLYCQTLCGTPDYLAPEMLLQLGHDTSLDMWQMGVLLFEMLAGKSPFGASNETATAKNILNVRLCFPDAFDKEAQQLVRALCRYDPKKRLSAAQAKEHAFVKKFDKLGAEAAAMVTVPDLDCARPSVVSTHIENQKVLVEAELMQILQSKTQMEAKMAVKQSELDEACGEFRRLKGEREKAEEERQKTKTREEIQKVEIAKLQRQIDEVVAKRAASQGACAA